MSPENIQVERLALFVFAAWNFHGSHLALIDTIHKNLFLFVCAEEINYF
jgi:hypothetical protein